MDRKTILAVDDDAGVLELVSTSLRSTGHRVLTAASGSGALARLAGGDVDLLVLDVMMPGMSGIEVARRVRLLAGADPRILVLSALGSHEDVERALAEGADDYLVKPFAVRELLQRAVSLLSRPPGAEPVAG